MCRLSCYCKLQVKTMMTWIELGVVLTLWSCNSDSDGLPIIKFWKGCNTQRASWLRKFSILLESRFLSEASQHVVMRFSPTSWYGSSRSYLPLSLSLSALLLKRMLRLFLYKINWDKKKKKWKSLVVYVVYDAALESQKMKSETNDTKRNRYNKR